MKGDLLHSISSHVVLTLVYYCSSRLCKGKAEASLARRELIAIHLSPDLHHKPKSVHMLV